MPCASPLTEACHLLDTQGNDEEAMQLCERSLAIREKVQGPDHPDTGSALRNKASLLLCQVRVHPLDVSHALRWLV